MILSNDGKILLKVDNNDIKDGYYEIPQGVNTISTRAFSRCGSLQNITIPQEVHLIDDWAFFGCTSLQTITILQRVYKGGYISKDAFLNCPRLNIIIIEGTDEASIKQVIGLLPKHLRDKAISKEIAKDIFQIREAQLSRIVQAPHINLLYRYLSYKAPYLSRAKGGRECSKLPDYLFEYMNGFSARDNPYYQEAQLLMHRERLPRNQEEIADYETRLKNIADGVIKKAQKFVAEERILIQTFAQKLQYMATKEAELGEGNEGEVSWEAEAIKTLRQEIIRSYQKTLFKEECKAAIDAIPANYPGRKLALSDLRRLIPDLERLFVLEKDIGQQSVTGKNFSFFSTDAPQEKSFHRKVKLIQRRAYGFE